MKLFLTFIYCIAAFALSAQDTYKYVDRYGNEIEVDTLNIPHELISFFTQQDFQWDKADSTCEHYHMHVLELKRIRRNKRYRLRFSSACYPYGNSLISIDVSIYNLHIEKSKNGSF